MTQTTQERADEIVTSLIQQMNGARQEGLIPTRLMISHEDLFPLQWVGAVQYQMIEGYDTPILCWRDIPIIESIPTLQYKRPLDTTD